MEPQRTAAERAGEFLAIASQFHLGKLPTEQPHPLTTDLSRLSQVDLPDALRRLHAVDSAALAVLPLHAGEISRLARRIATTLSAGKKVFLCGCGATGRLSLACETIWRALVGESELRERVVGFMAGGDVALVRSIENFEDHAEYGARQLEELGFADGDLLVGITEGGETPFVIGATLSAARHSSTSPVFMYCNPDSVLRTTAARSESVLADRRIEKINLTVGPMAITGSTRMQASTVLMATVGVALLSAHNGSEIAALFNALIDAWTAIDLPFLVPFIERESMYYRRGEYVVYETDADLGVTILTDTTERSPTFSMIPFENALDLDAPLSSCYLCLRACNDSASAWQALLGREPRALDWPHTRHLTSLERLLGFDFGAKAVADRAHRLPPNTTQHRFAITSEGGTVSFDLDGLSYRLALENLPTLHRHLILKMLLNMHSTLVMGRLGRYDGNVMTWVRPSNNKLIDRAIRYADALLRRSGIEVDYDAIALACFQLADTLPPDKPLVHALVEHLTAGHRDQNSAVRTQRTGRDHVPR